MSQQLRFFEIGVHFRLRRRTPSVHGTFVVESTSKCLNDLRFPDFDGLFGTVGRRSLTHKEENHNWVFISSQGTKQTVFSIKGCTSFVTPQLHLFP